MRPKSKATAVALAGAVALSSAAYGIGTQAGGGTASAENGGSRNGAAADCERGFALRFDGLAERLGVSAAQLREALRDFHDQNAGDPRGDFATALAEALGKSASEVEDALDELGPGRGNGGPMHPFVSLQRLAAALDVTRAELRDALSEVRAGMESNFEERHAALVEFLAERFNLSQDDVEEALPEPEGRPRGPHRLPPPGFGFGGP